jgi:hypothetical protein
MENISWSIRENPHPFVSEPRLAAPFNSFRKLKYNTEEIQLLTKLQVITQHDTTRATTGNLI